MGRDLVTVGYCWAAGILIFLAYKICRFCVVDGSCKPVKRIRRIRRHSISISGGCWGEDDSDDGGGYDCEEGGGDYGGGDYCGGGGGGNDCGGR